MTIQETQACCPELLADVESGDEVVIARRGKPVARSFAYERRKRRRSSCVRSFAGPPIDPSAFDPMTDDELREWGLL